MLKSIKKAQFYPKLLNMDLKQIHDLIKVVNKSNIGEISIEDKDGKVTIKQKEERITVNSVPVATNLLTIKSPMIGTFYRRAAPDKPLMAEEGTAVAPGKVVCIIEAMKLFNEIESEVKGTIVKILVDDASPVEYDQPLFLVQPE